MHRSAHLKIKIFIDHRPKDKKKRHVLTLARIRKGKMGKEKKTRAETRIRSPGVCLI